MKKTQRPLKNRRLIYDVLYGFVPITEWEEKIINSTFFQRLRWIKQLGFANYIFPGAEHNRFTHVIGVMHTMNQMIQSLGLAVPDDQLFDRKATNQAALFHKSLRIAALLHDIGTFPFSHAIEYAYIRHGNHPHENLKALPNSHEHLGSFIIKNTDYDGGLTQILEDYGFDAHHISRLIKGESSSFIANQLMHSDLDADRMDYLLRDSHYTGMKYGQFDREYILSNLVTYQISPSQIAFGVRENAIQTVEDFLMARLSWYSQVIKNPDSAKFDIMSSHIAESFLANNLMYQFQDLLTLISEKDERFHWWNDIYFITRCQEIRQNDRIADVRIAELTEMLLYRKAPKKIRHPYFEHQILSSEKNGIQKKESILKINQLVNEWDEIIHRYGTGREWILADIPDRDIVITAGFKKNKHSPSLQQFRRSRDPVRIISRSGKPELLIDKGNSLVKYLSNLIHFAPSLFANDAAVKLLKKRRMI